MYIPFLVMVVYFHRNPVTYEIFYVGIASENKRCQRPFKKDNRNKYWNHYVNKHGGFIVQLVHKGLNKESAFWWERWYISILGKKINGGQLVNIADGGESNEGYIQTEYQRKCSALRARERGISHMMTPECRKKAVQNISKALTGKLVGEKNPNYGNRWTDEMKENLRIKKLGKTLTKEQAALKRFKEKLSKAHFVYDKEMNCIFLSIKDAAQHYNLSPGYVSCMLRGIRNNILPIELYSRCAI